MIGKLMVFFLVFFCPFILSSCAAKQQAPSVHEPSDAAKAESESADGEFRRFIAMRHSLTVETSEDDLPGVWKQTMDFCGSIRCEVLSSTINNKTPDTMPSGKLSLRVSPEDFPGLLEHIAKTGSVIQHETKSEDKTAAVVDTEARLKNLTELRDRLRAMLSAPNAGLKDVVEVEKELARAQSELDSLTRMRKILADETEKTAVEINYRSRKTVARRGVFAPISAAFRESGEVFMESLATVITFFVAVIPWLLLVAPFLIISFKLFWRLFRRKPAVGKAEEKTAEQRPESGASGVEGSESSGPPA